MLKVILTKGLPASGKSTWAKSVIKENLNSYKRINKDDLRAMLDNNHHSKDAEKFILNVRDSLILMCLEEGKHVIVDDTNLASKHEERIRQLVKGKAVVEIKDFTEVPLETCIKQDLKRCDSVGEKVIRDMWKQYLKPKDETIAHIKGLNDVIICDLDGTLCLLNGRNPYDASTCDNDGLNSVVADIIRGRDVIFLSGREDKYMEPTLKFMEKYSISFISLHMRKSGDMRKDSIVKREMFDEHIRGNYNVNFVLDDRNQVVELWRSMGLTCLQVADGDF